MSDCDSGKFLTEIDMTLPVVQLLICAICVRIVQEPRIVGRSLPLSVFLLHPHIHRPPKTE